jgi:hypothetical protein
MTRSEADPRDLSLRNLGARLEQEGFVYEYRDAKAPDCEFVDRYRHPDGRTGMVGVKMSGGAYVLREEPETRH